MKKMLFFAFLTIILLSSFAFSKQKNNGSLGILITSLDDRFVIQSVLTGGPADISGIKAGDTIISVNDKDIKSVNNKSMDELLNILKGPAGSDVVLSLKRKDVDELLIITVRRQEIDKESLNNWKSNMSEEAIKNGILINAPYSSVWSSIVLYFSKNNIKTDLLDKDSGVIQSKEIYVTRDFDGIKKSEIEPKRMPDLKIDDFIDKYAIRPKSKNIFLSWMGAKYRYTINLKDENGSTRIFIYLYFYGWNTMNGWNILESNGSFEYSLAANLSKFAESNNSDKGQKNDVSPAISNECYDLCNTLEGENFRSCMQKCKK